MTISTLMQVPCTENAALLAAKICIMQNPEKNTAKFKL